MTGCIYKMKRAFLTVFGDIKVFKWPMFFLYHPSSFSVKGAQTRKVMHVLKPGDVLLRSYRDYLDGYFIPKGESGCSHSGVYVGDGQIVHSIAEGSVIEDVINFCRTDRVMVLRAASGQAFCVEHANKCADANIPYNFDFTAGKGKYYCHEFTASCYPDLGIKELSGRVLKIIKTPEAYLADSFYLNENFTIVYDGEVATESAVAKGAAA